MPLPPSVLVLFGAVLITFSAVGCAATPNQGTTVLIGPDLRFTVEVADSEAARQLGLSGRADLPAGTGMLFRYDESARRSYWMAGMLVPIDLAWIDDGEVLGTQTLPPCVNPAADACPTFASPGPVDTVLEAPAGALASVETGTAVVVSGR